ncbi:hypothetical protein [Microcoleus sp.]|uniref:hypothetical protein n=1 Tax=Microcoleus sp. TaxID=44472 RepID=UPI00403E3E8F
MGGRWEGANCYCCIADAVQAHGVAGGENRAVVRSNNVSLAKITANTTPIRS